MYLFNTFMLFSVVQHYYSLSKIERGREGVRGGEEREKERDIKPRHR